ncbi:hypothetical protein Ae201684P_006196 [Aphanomyces euteiches]|nr:hypothetical protein Ae201684P_006196 [Aphanomyces euteiches]
MAVAGRVATYYDRVVSDPKAKAKGTLNLAKIQRHNDIARGKILQSADGKSLVIYIDRVEEFATCFNAIDAVLSPSSENASRPSLTSAIAQQEPAFTQPQLPVNQDILSTADKVDHAGWPEQQATAVASNPVVLLDHGKASTDDKPIENQEDNDNLKDESAAEKLKAAFISEETHSSSHCTPAACHATCHANRRKSALLPHVVKPQAASSIAKSVGKSAQCTPAACQCSSRTQSRTRGRYRSSQ